MIVEYVRYELRSDVVESFHHAYAAVGECLTNDPHCLGWDMQQGIEEPRRHVVRIQWDSVQGHEEGFRGTDAYATFLQRLRPFREYVSEMGHYEQVTCGSRQ